MYILYWFVQCSLWTWERVSRDVWVCEDTLRERDTKRLSIAQCIFFSLCMTFGIAAWCTSDPCLLLFSLESRRTLLGNDAFSKFAKVRKWIRRWVITEHRHDLSRSRRPKGKKRNKTVCSEGSVNGLQLVVHRSRSLPTPHTRRQTKSDTVTSLQQYTAKHNRKKKYTHWNEIKCLWRNGQLMMKKPTTQTEVLDWTRLYSENRVCR